MNPKDNKDINIEENVTTTANSNGENTALEQENTESGSTNINPEILATAKELATSDYETEIIALKDRLLRAVAEAENTRRRAEIDVQNAKSYGISSFARDLLSVMDNLFRAAETITTDDLQNDPKLKSLHEGIEITKREMLGVFEKNHIKRIAEAGVAFDHNLHQAISKIADPNHTSGNVAQVLQAGYQLRDRLIRPALVVVAE